MRQHPGSTTALRGLMASLALRSARPWRAMSMRDRPAGCASCATPLVRRSVRQRAAAARRPTSMVCWWRSGDAGGAENQRPSPISKPRCDLRFVRASLNSSVLTALRRDHYFGQLNADRLSGALSICRTQQSVTVCIPDIANEGRGWQRRFAPASGLDALIVAGTRPSSLLGSRLCLASKPLRAGWWVQARNARRTWLD